MDLEDDTYGSIFKALQHPIRRRILKMLDAGPSSYTDILRSLNIDNGLLNYHLDNLGELVSKLPDERYTLSEYGRAAVALNQRVEEPAPREEVRVMEHKIDSRVLKAATALLLVAVVTFAGLYIDLNGKYSALTLANEDTKARLTESETKLEGLSTLMALETFVKESSDFRVVCSFTSSYYQSYVTYLTSNGNVTKRFDSSGLPWVFVYVPEAGATLTLIAIVQSGEGTKAPITVQKAKSGRLGLDVISKDDVVFSGEAFPFAEFSVPLPESGWYLVSSQGLIDGNSLGYHYSPAEGNFNLHLQIQMSLNGERTLFGASGSY